MVTIGLDTSALDPAFKAHAGRGIGRYVQEITKYFDAQPNPAVRVEYFDHRLFQNASLIDKIVEYLPAGKMTVRQQMLYPFRLKSSSTARFDALHFPAHMDAPSWSMKRYILTVLDLIPLVLSELYKADRPGWRFHFARFLEIRAIKNAALILAISECTARDLERVLEIPRERIVVTPLGVDEKFFRAKLLDPEVALRSRLGIQQERPLVLYVGGIDARKNYRTMLKTMEHLVRMAVEQKKPAPLLLMAGKIEKDRNYPKLVDAITAMDLSDHIKLLGYVPDHDLLQLYALCSVFYFPSLYEGFGLPPLEALAAGMPVVSSNTSSLPEVLGEAAVLVAPEDARLAAAEINRILHDREHAARLREVGPKRARLFPWAKTAALTLEAYARFV